MWQKLAAFSTTKYSFQRARICKVLRQKHHFLCRTLIRRAPTKDPVFCYASSSTLYTGEWVGQLVGNSLCLARLASLFHTLCLKSSFLLRPTLISFQSLQGTKFKCNILKTHISEVWIENHKNSWREENAKYTYVKCGASHPWLNSGWQVESKWQVDESSRCQVASG